MERYSWLAIKNRTNTERVEGFAQGDEWIRKLQEIYEQITDNEGKETISYEVNRNKEKYRISLPELSEKALAEIEGIL